MTQTTKCRVCRDRRVGQADAMLRAGRSQADVSRFLGHATPDATHYHVSKGHVAPAPSSSPPPPPPPLGLDPAAELRAQLDGLNAIDDRGMSPSARIGLFDAKRRTAEALAKSTPPPSEDDAAVLARYIRHPAVARFEAAIFEALEPHVDARRALAAVFRKRLAAAGQEEEA